MELVSEDELERSSVVANCRMNRERTLHGTNGYDRDLTLDPVEVLGQRLAKTGVARWLDLCCGSGRALIEAAGLLRQAHPAGQLEIVGVDLVGMFAPEATSVPELRLLEMPLRHYQPAQAFDLITCVHGLHYVGDKLSLLASAANWLTKDGTFVANLDLDNIQHALWPHTRAKVAALRASGLEYDSRRKLVSCSGRRQLHWQAEFLGANPQAGPNYTGQPAVTSHYR